MVSLRTLKVYLFLIIFIIILSVLIAVETTSDTIYNADGGMLIETIFTLNDSEVDSINKQFEDLIYSKIIKILKQNNYTLKFKTLANYVFVKK